MKLNRRTINTISILITSVIISMTYFIPKVIFKTAVNDSKEMSIQDDKIEITEWGLKIPELMLSKIIVEESKDNNQGNIVHYKKSHIENGTIILFCKEKINNIKSEVSIYYKVNEEIFEYKSIEKNTIKKNDLDILLR